MIHEDEDEEEREKEYKNEVFSVWNEPQIGVSLRRLTKVYKLPNGESRVAVDRLSLDFYQGDVTTLLGHNGAGKSTTM